MWKSKWNKKESGGTKRQGAEQHRMDTGMKTILSTTTHTILDPTTFSCTSLSRTALFKRRTSGPTAEWATSCSTADRGKAKVNSPETAWIGGGVIMAAVENELPPPLWNRARHVSVNAAATEISPFWLPIVWFHGPIAPEPNDGVDMVLLCLPVTLLSGRVSGVNCIGVERSEGAFGSNVDLFAGGEDGAAESFGHEEFALGLTVFSVADEHSALSASESNGCYQ